MSERKLMYLDGEARDRMIRFLRRRMEEWNISLSDLKESMTANSNPQHSDFNPIIDDGASIYRDVFGNSWDGQGEQPEWVRRAVSLGLSLEHFRVRH
jgi:DNA-binding protein H-NS